MTQKELHWWTLKSCLVFTITFVVVAWAGLHTAHAEDGLAIPAKATDQADVAASELLCRLGVNATHSYVGPFDAVDMAQLRTGWYIDYRAPVAPARPNNIEHAPVIRITQTGPSSYSASPGGSQLRSVVTANPGVDWIIGNEPDRRQVQDDLQPHIYALAYHDLYGQIKKADPTAKIFAGAIVQPTPLRLQYLDMVLKSYYRQFGHGLPADGWAIHNFILNEASCDHYKDLQVCWGADIPPDIDAIDGLRIEPSQHDDFSLFVEQVTRFRLWMATRGYMGKPLYVSEYGVLMPEWVDLPTGFPPERVNTFMNKSLDYLLNTTNPIYGDPADGYRIVQRLAWFSTVTTDFNGYLFQRDSDTAPYRLSAMGENWVNYVNTITSTTDLYPLYITFDPAAPLIDQGAVDVKIKAVVANSGNTLTPQPLTVRFYDGDPKQGGTLIGTKSAALTGCGETVELSVTWPKVEPAKRRVYVSVESNGSTPESNKENNILSATLFFASQQVFLPAILRPLMVP